MRYRDAVAFRQALEQRLKTRSGGEAARLTRDRKRVVFDRLLARLLIAAPGRWLLKGGFALDLRLADRARTTKDVDIDWRAGEEDLHEALIDAAESGAGDFFSFAIERSGTPGDRLGGSHRFKISASLAGRPFETFLLDVGFRIGGVIATEMLQTEDLLAFADIAPVEVEAVPIELQVAEKLHAYTRTYDSGRPSTRAKDLVDLVLIGGLSRLDAGKLHTAIDGTYKQRDIHPVPRSLPSPPPEWQPQYHRLAEEVGVPVDLEVGHRVAAAFLDPALSGQIWTGSWNPERRRWEG